MRANNVLGIIHSQAYDSTIRELTTMRTVASVPFGCRYRFIDFPLSNMVNAGITEVGIITKENYQSLMDHIGSGKPWDLARKREGLYLLPPYNTSSSVATGRNNRLDSLYSNLDFLRKSRHEYAVITDANAVYNFDFQDMFNFHTEQEADITIAYKHGKLPALKNIQILNMDADKRVKDVTIGTPESGEEEVDYSFNIYVMRKSLLEYLIQGAIAHSKTSFSKDVIQAQANEGDLKIVGYEIDGFAEMIDSLKTYYKVSMELLEPENRKALLDPKNPIATKIADNVPTLYGESSQTGNSLIADGCTIEGTVENSLLFRGVIVEKGAVVKNSILMQGTVVHANAKVDSVVTDKNVTITANRNLAGDPSYPIYFTKNIVV